MSQVFFSKIINKLKSNNESIVMACCGFKVEKLYALSKIENDSFKDEQGRTYYF